MTSPSELIFHAATLQTTLFPPNSRYYGIETAVYDIEPERPVLYIRRRFLPNPAKLQETGQHIVRQGERLDHIAAARLGDPEVFWQICDANAAMRPEELTEAIGRRLRITLPPPAPGGTVA
jgi:hypothetical protein